MTIFTSQPTPYHDPKPWITRQGYHTDRYRYAENVNGVLVWEPRVEFNPTRDPEPYVAENGARLDRAVEVYLDESGKGGYFPYTGMGFAFSPRPRYAGPPVNRVLAAFREQLNRASEPITRSAMSHSASFWVDDLDVYLDFNPTPEEERHALKVLARLA